LLAYCAGRGWIVRGWPGALIALCCSSLPCSFIAIAATVLYEWATRDPWVKIAMQSAFAAAVGVMLATGWTLVRPYRRSLPVLRFVLFSLGSRTAALLGVSPIRVLFVAAILGALWPNATRRA
jgi:chromate transporter